VDQLLALRVFVRIAVSGAFSRAADSTIAEADPELLE
jgi:hypothetical protein